MKRFPYLARESVTRSDAVDLWHGRIKTQFKNNRFRLRDTIPEILAKRQKFGKKRKSADNIEEQTPKKITRCWGVDNFLPDIPEGEDDFTWQKFQQILKEQHNQPLHKQSTEIIDRTMKKTFPHRRKLLVKDLIRLTELIQIYPILCSEDPHKKINREKPRFNRYSKPRKKQDLTEI